MRFLLITCLCLYVSCSAFGQVLDSTSIEKYANENAEALIANLPDGVYDDCNSFLAKAPSNGSAIIQKVSDGGAKFNFYHGKKRIKRAFAVVYKGDVFFQTKLIIRYPTNDCRGFSWDGGPYFIKAKVVGRFLYAEDYLTPASAGMMGGMIAIVASRKLKPIIFIEHLQKFRVIKNYEHLKVFIETKYPNDNHLVKSKKAMKEEATAQGFVKIVKGIIEQIE